MVSGDDIFNVIKVGVIIPQGLFGAKVGYPDAGSANFSALQLPFKGQTGMGATYGATLQYEGFSAFGKPHSGPSFTTHFGLEYGFDFGFIPVSWSNVQWANYNLSVTTTSYYYAGFKVGPAFYINPTKDMGIGIYALADPYVNAPGGENASYNYTDASGTTTVGSYVIKDSNSVHFSINASAGMNFYYKAIIIGVEYNWIHTRYNGTVIENLAETQSNGSVSTPKYNYSFGNVIQTNIIKFTLGVRLGYGCKYRNFEDVE